MGPAPPRGRGPAGCLSAVADGLGLVVLDLVDAVGARGLARADQLDAAQAEARADERGLWAPDACGRVDADAGALVVERIEADPPGDDTLDPNAEYAVVANRSDGEVDLTGWVLKDETASHRFAFPAGFTLPAGATVTVRTGCGSPTATDLFWCNQGSAVWNNDGDTAFLLDPNGNVVDTRSY